jgi:predicted nucleotidyltransferase
MFTKKDLMIYISDYIVECNRIGVHFKRVILFGSYARNTPHEWSDVDLALVSDDFTGMRIDDRGKISLANIKFVDIEPHIFNTTYFEEGDPFIEEIIKTSKEIKLKQTV